MWKRGSFVFSTEYDTAALEIIDGKFRINFNPRYWKKIVPLNRWFIICHEYMHVILGHWLNPAKGVDTEWMNIAQDIQVNELLIGYFSPHVRGPVRTSIKGWEDQAWLDTVFKDKVNFVEKNREAEYYYNLLIKCLY